MGVVLGAKVVSMVRISSIIFLTVPVLAWAAIPPSTVTTTTTVSTTTTLPASISAPQTAPEESATEITGPVGGVVTEIRAQRSPVPDFDGDLNNLAAGESRYREDSTRQSRLKSAIKGNVARK